MNISELDEHDDLTGVPGEIVRRAVRRFAASDPLQRGCPHAGAAIYYTALCENRTWCESCAVSEGLLTRWEAWPTCMGCGVALGSDRVLSGSEALGSVVFMTTCRTCAADFAALRGGKDQ